MALLGGGSKQLLNTLEKLDSRVDERYFEIANIDARVQLSENHLPIHLKHVAYGALVEFTQK